MSRGAPAGAGDEIQLMQGGVREWVQQAARQGKSRAARSASPTVLLSLLCASAFCPLLMVSGVAGAGFGVLSSVGGGLLTQVCQRRAHPVAPAWAGARTVAGGPGEGIAQQIQQVLAAGDHARGRLAG